MAKLVDRTLTEHSNDIKEHFQFSVKDRVYRFRVNFVSCVVNYLFP